jgi:hypothetical protein
VNIGAGDQANAISSDGSTVVGVINATSHAGVWTAATGFVDIGTLPGDTISQANAVNANGSVVVGFSSTIATQTAIRWTASAGMQSIQALLTAQGVSLAGWQLQTATGVSADGTVIVGNGNDPSHAAQAWIARLSGTAGIITPQIIQQSVQNQSTVIAAVTTTQVDSSNTVLTQYLVNAAAASNAQAAFAAASPPSLNPITIGGGGGGVGVSVPTGGPEPVGGGADAGSGGFDPHDYRIMRYAPDPELPGVFDHLYDQVQALGLRPGGAATPSLWSVFLLGAGTSSPSGSGQLGVMRTIWPDTQIGGSISATYAHTATADTGSTTTNSASAAFLFTHMPAAGLQWVIDASGVYSAMNIKRGYLNGDAPVTSNGTTASGGYGIVGRIGWTFAQSPQLSFTPYASYSVAGVDTHPYTENGGPFPMQFAAVNSTTHTVRAGMDTNYTLTKEFSLFWGADWAHKFEPTSPTITGTLIGLFPTLTPGSPLDQDWLELDGGVSIQVNANTSLTMTGNTSAFAHAPAVFQASMNLSRTF